MKCLILSDSHRSFENVERAIKRNPDAEVVFFLGDGIEVLYDLIDRYPNKAWLCVQGNCDRPTVLRGQPVKKTDSITILGKRIAFTHGDLYGAKYGDGGLLSLASEERAHAVLHGHTHEPRETYYPDSGVWLFNPGALEASWGKPSSFGLLTISEKGDMLFSHGTLD